MISVNEIKQGIIAKLKANATIVAELENSEQIKEHEYQGTEYSYPAVRVQILPASPLADKDCLYIRADISIAVYTEDDNSLDADRIAGIINNELHGKQFVSNNVVYSLRTTNLVPAYRSDIRIWRSEILMTGIISG